MQPYCAMASLCVCLWFVLVFAASAFCSGGNYSNYHYVNHVQSETGELCPAIPCHSWSHYLNNFEFYFKSNTIFWFTSGEHYAASNLEWRNVTNVALIGSSSVEEQLVSVGQGTISGVRPTTKIICNSSARLFTFMEIVQLTVANISFSNCGRLVDHHELFADFSAVFGTSKAYPYIVTALLLINTSNVFIEGVLLHDCTGFGFLAINMFGNSVITNSQFIHSHDETYSGGSATIVFTETDINNCNSVMQINISATNFLFGDTHVIHYWLEDKDLDPISGVHKGGGLNIVLKPTSYRVVVYLDHIVAAQNYGVWNAGANLWILIYDATRNYYIRVSHSQISHAVEENFGSSIQLGYDLDSVISPLNVSIDPASACPVANHPGSIELVQSKFSYNMINALHICNQLEQITIVDCSFTDNANTALIVSRIKPIVIVFGGTVVFRNNTGRNGGAMMLQKESRISLKASAFLLIVNNHAFLKGGGIYISDSECSGESTCFALFSKHHTKHPQITFVNNTANIAGSAVYGYTGTCTSKNYGSVFQLSEFHNFFGDLIVTQSALPEDMSLVASNPRHICFCNHMSIRCTMSYRFMSSNKKRRADMVIRVFPGQEFPLEIAATGIYYEGLVPAPIQGKLLMNSSLKHGQEIQEVGNNCTKLSYTVFTTNIHEQIRLQLSLHESLELRSPNPQDEPEPVFIDIYHDDCPTGFVFSSYARMCTCARNLQAYNVTCSIDNLSIERKGSLWIHGYPFENKTHPTSVVLHEHCPFDYCRPEAIKLNLANPDIQCSYNRSGILCGSCKPGLSLQLGNSKCEPCKNQYIALVLLFVFLGVVLVFFLTLLNITVSTGKINGLIFFANMVQVNNALLFPKDSSYLPLRFALKFQGVFIAWLNLDFGFEVCFFNSMDIYARTWLQFAFPVYVWIIITIMIVLTDRYSIAVKLLGPHAVSVLATLLLLSYTKLQRAIITAFSFTYVYNSEENAIYKVWLYDGNVNFLQGKHIALFLTALVFTVLYIIPFTLLLLLIPLLQARSGHPMLRWVTKIMPVLDAYQGPYKNKFRFWTGFMLVVRNIIFLIRSINILGDPAINLLAVIITVFCLLSLMFLLGLVYKSKPLNVVEVFFLLALGVLASGTLFIGVGNTTKQMYVTLVVTGGTFIMFLLILFSHFIVILKQYRVFRSCEKAVQNQACRVTELNADSTNGAVEHTRSEVPVTVVELREPLLTNS